MKIFSFSLAIGSRVRQGSLLNPFKAQIISWLNLLTDTNDAVYNGISPTNIEIELAVDLINGQII